MKTKEELNTLKEELESLNKKLAELNEEEFKQVTGGNTPLLPLGALIGFEPLNVEIDSELQKTNPTWEFINQIGIDK